MLKWLKSLIQSGVEEVPAHTVDKDVVFLLKFDELPIGELRVSGKEWLFQYSNEFKKQKAVAPLIDFPITEKEYRSEQLWPFFSLRIPSLEQPAVQEMMQREKLESVDKVTLLKTFGRRTISNPFDLVSVGS